MIKKNKNLIIILFGLILEIIVLLNPNTLVTYSKIALELFINKIFITLFPFFILNKILIKYNLPYYISKIKKDGTYLSIIILSMLSGMPSNAEYIKDYLDNNLISLDVAEKLLIVTFFPSPVFVITVVGYFGFNSILLGAAILLIIYIINLVLWIIIKDKKIVNNKLILKNNKSFITSLKESIVSSFESLMIILGNIIIFSILVGLLSKYLNINIYFECIITGLLELSNGIKKISTISTNFSIKFSLCLFALSFSGISIHSQVSSILSEYNIKFHKIILYRLLISICLLCFSYMILYLIKSTHLFH